MYFYCFSVHFTCYNYCVNPNGNQENEAEVVLNPETIYLVAYSEHVWLE